MGDSPRRVRHEGSQIPQEPETKRRASVVAFPAVLAERLRDYALEHPRESLEGYDPRENAGFALLSSGRVAVVSLCMIGSLGVWHLSACQTTYALSRQDLEEILVAFGAAGGVEGKRPDGWRWFAWEGLS